MRNGLILLIFGLLSSNCTYQDRASIKTDSIAFHNLENVNDYLEFSSFLLKHPESVHFEEVVRLYFEKKRTLFDSLGWPVIDCFGNCANIKIRPNQNILFEYEKTQLNDLSDSLLAFFINETNSELRSIQIETIDFNGASRRVSKGYVELTYIKDSCEILQNVIEEISKSVTSYKNQLSINWYSKELNSISKTKFEHLDSLVNIRLLIIELEEEYFSPPPPPPPPMFSEIIDNMKIKQLINTATRITHCRFSSYVSLSALHQIL
ncbi:hypothetical protein [Alkalitalea saponilacus]|uniref:Uncharacterized protein n=1 Tax=Alkalitalea saponilacus TaxID=889453 RepID=A0A1T5HUB6_9BACT|nr:hypothetical protein [Alkalitalea saponilacus]ASB50363.1 hypothetical protein CDL62_15025 [Alkalitalea saponilacus]SKC24286.1 hypothetical protein SAMN03080601_03585 [Alkalitalea saponilacus]